MHGIIFHMDLQSVPLSFGINDCTKLVPEEREREYSLAPPWDSAALWSGPPVLTTKSYWLLACRILATMGSSLSVGKGHLPHPPCHSSLLLLLVRDVICTTLPVSWQCGKCGHRCSSWSQPHTWQHSVLVPSETCHWAKTHTHWVLFLIQSFS